jgi:pimeloyl-ACP methyl ester carboxylesterase
MSDPMPAGPSTPRDRRVPGDGVALRARDWGGDGPAVVLLHGLASNARIWDGVAPRLVGAGFRVVALDQRGHGGSDQPTAGYDLATVGHDLASVLAAADVRRPVLAGHSWGAHVALQFAADRPGAAAGLALVDGAFSDVAGWAGPDRAAARRNLTPPRFAVPLEEWLARAGRFTAPGSGRDGWIRDFLRAGVDVDDRGVATARFRFDNHMRAVDALLDQRLDALYERLDCPVLLCPAGAGDEAAAARRAGVKRILAARPDTRVTWFEETAHDIPLHRPERLAAELARFAGEVTGRG